MKDFNNLLKKNKSSQLPSLWWYDTWRFLSYINCDRTHQFLVSSKIRPCLAMECKFLEQPCAELHCWCLYFSRFHPNLQLLCMLVLYSINSMRILNWSIPTFMANYLYLIWMIIFIFQYFPYRTSTFCAKFVVDDWGDFSKSIAKFYLITSLVRVHSFCQILHLSRCIKTLQSFCNGLTWYRILFRIQYDLFH